MYKTGIVLGILIILIAIIELYLSIPKIWTQYERECEYPDKYTVGQTIRRSNATGSDVHGQFGATVDAPWSAQSGYVVYNNIKIPEVDRVYLRIRYSKNSPSSTPVLIYVDDESNPRAMFYPSDLGTWNTFIWTEPLLLGSMNSGVHSILLYTKGQQYGVADLDGFILTTAPP